MKIKNLLFNFKVNFYWILHFFFRGVETKKGMTGRRMMIEKIRKKTDPLLSHLGNLQGEMHPKIENLMIMGANPWMEI